MNAKGGDEEKFNLRRDCIIAKESKKNGNFLMCRIVCLRKIQLKCYMKIPFFMTHTPVILLTLSQVLPLFTLVHFQFAPALVEITSLNGHKNLLEKVTFKQI
jgi:hypothetical protein